MKLSKRDKHLVLVAGCCIVLFSLLQFLVFPFFEKRSRIEKTIKAKENGLREIIKLGSEFRSYQKNSQNVQYSMARRKPGFTLFSFLEAAAGEAEVKSNIKYMKPSVSSGTGPYKEAMVEMKLEAITLQQMVGYLYRIEDPDNVVSIKRISISENKKNKGCLDAILQVLTVQ